MCNLIVRSFPRSLMKPIRLLEYWGSRTISWLRRPRSLKWSCLKSELFKVRAQLERTSSAKLDDILSIQKSASDRTSLEYGLSSFNIASSSTTVFVPSANNVKIENNEIKTELASENIDKGKFILGAPLKLEKKDVKNPRAKKSNSQKPKQKK